MSTPVSISRRRGTDVDAYLADFFDGEGHVCLTKSKGGWSYSIRIGATNTNQLPLFLLRSLYGGTITSKKVTNPKHKIAYQWRASGKDALYALSRMVPFLRIKDTKAHAALRILTHTPHKGSLPSRLQQAVLSRAAKQFQTIIEINKRP